MTDAHNITYWIAQLSAADPKQRANAAGMLGKLGDAQAVPALMVALADPKTHVRRAAAWALSVIPDAPDARALEALTAALVDKDTYVVSMALSTLGKIGDARAIPALRLKFQRSPKMRYHTALAMAHLGDAIVRPFLEAMLASPYYIYMHPQIKEALDALDTHKG
jgi:HEAT repeat protein